MYPFEEGDGLCMMYDWNLWTAPQVHLDGDSRPYNMGHGVGGGSIINTMCSTRGGKVDFDACVALVIMDGVGMICFHISRKRKNYQDEVDADFSHELYIHPNASTYSNAGMFM